MANELDKTIEELEAEVISELEEANGTDAPMKSAGKPEKMDTMDSDGATENEGEIGGPSPTKDAKQAGKIDPAKKVKKDSSAPAKTGGAAEAGIKSKMESFSDEEIRELCHTKDHDCATFVEHPVFGKGKPIKESHAIPDADGYVAWYDVTFKHGVERKVMAEDMKILQTEAHHEKKENMTKDKMINAMKDMMMGMHKEKKDVIQATYDKMMAAYGEGAHEETEEEKAKSEAVENRLKSIDVSEHLEALISGEGDLSEDFKRKAATVFEAAVKSKVRDEVSKIEDDYRKELDENINANKDELTTKVDTYLNYVCEEWTKENELAIERGLKGEIAEDFISGLKQLFEDHYIDVPNEKYDVLEAQSEKISQLEAKLNEAIEKNVSMKTDNAKLVREQVISEMSSDLAETEIEKFKSLTEDVDFEDEASYKEKLETLKENYFPKQKTVVAETVDNVETGNAQDIDVSNSMTAYMSAIGRVAKGQ